MLNNILKFIKDKYTGMDTSEELPVEPSKDLESSKSVNLCFVCQKPADKKCSACKMVWYCSSEHQKTHWKEHKKECQSYEVQVSETLGKHLIATRDLSPGDVVLTEYPLAFGPKPHSLLDGPVPCLGCCMPLYENKCAYCPECHWPICNLSCEGLKDPYRHGFECNILRLRPLEKKPDETANFYEYYRFDVLIILRMLALQKLNIEKWNQVLELEDHAEERDPGTETYSLIEEKIIHLKTNYLLPLQKFEECNGTTILPQVSDALIHKLYGILDVNATELSEDHVEAEVLYHTTSLIEHNCTPNTCQIIADKTDKFKITIRAALPIAKGQNIRTIYNHILWGTQARREHLKLTKYFDCFCERCKDPTEFGTYLSALKCLGTEKDPCGGTQLPANPTTANTNWICNKCKIVLQNDEIMKFVQHLGGEVDKILARRPKLEELEDILEKLLKFLHPNHYHVYAIKHSLVQMYNSNSGHGIQSSDNILKDKVKMCQELINITKKIDPGNARLSMYLVVLQHELFTSKFSLLNRNFDKDDSSKYDIEILEIGELLQETRATLQYESSSGTGAKFLEIITKNENMFQTWLQENKIPTD